MAFSVVSKKSGKTFYLHSRETNLPNGKVRKLFFFSGTQGEGALDNLPEGYEVIENEKTGLPMLKKSIKT
ncbi:MAG: hypothetical protein JO317_09005 [Verrucomicrobiae bacterium]|nr:hypothetical protein [Verrucomicrobiae bacterium]